MPTENLRADAERNRRLLVETAHAVFAERGLDAPLDEIARRAGVGNATLYRRFPARRDLIAAVFLDTLRQVVDASKRALADLLTASIGGKGELAELRGVAFDNLNRLIDNAQDAGALRADFGHADVVLILMAGAGLVQRTA